MKKYAASKALKRIGHKAAFRGNSLVSGGTKGAFAKNCLTAGLEEVIQVLLSPAAPFAPAGIRSCDPGGRELALLQRSSEGSDSSA